MLSSRSGACYGGGRRYAGRLRAMTKARDTCAAQFEAAVEHARQLQQRLQAAEAVPAGWRPLPVALRNADMEEAA